MKYDPHLHHRKSIRLKGFDYSLPGAYFVTVVTKDQENLFGEISNGTLKANRYAEITQKAWKELPRQYANVSLDSFLIMPNHIDGIIVINDTALGRGGSFVGKENIDIENSENIPIKEYPLETRPYSMIRHGLSEIIRAFKSFSSRKINNIRGTSGRPVWQRNYYERIIRNQRELDAIHAYIADNPRRWLEDQEFKK
jgi:REP-associated tyrosine transposase